MRISEFFRTFAWVSTLQIAGIRIGAATLLWVLLFLIFGRIADLGAFFGMIGTWLIFLTVAVAVAIPASTLARADVPYVGVLALPAWLIVIGDPLVRILWKNRPDLVPVEEFKFFNPPVLGVFITEEETHEAPSRTGTETVVNDEENPIRELLITCNENPSEGLGWISRLDPSLQANPMVMFARFTALRHLALDEVFLGDGALAIGSVTGADLKERMTPEQFSFAEQALIEIAKIESVDPDYVLGLVSDGERFGESMVDDICTVMERRYPGKVQKVLGWTKLIFFGDERLGVLPEVRAEADINQVREAFGQRVRPPKIVLSAMCSDKGVDDKGRGFLDILLMERDFNETSTLGDAQICCLVRVFDDGEVSSSEM